MFGLIAALQLEDASWEDLFSSDTSQLEQQLDAIENNRKHRCNGDLALHVLDIIECAMISSIYKVEVDLRSTCERPIPFNDDEIQKLSLEINND